MPGAARRSSEVGRCKCSSKEMTARAYSPGPRGPPPLCPRRTHRKRTSALRLSSDTTATLPEYITWRDALPPPQYEADIDDDTDSQSQSPYTVLPPSPRRRTHRRRPSSPQAQQDVFLDSLLERSVHALELSNALLQSSMAPGRAPSPIPMPGRVPPPHPPRERWADDLDAIARDVDDLLVSASLPASVSPVATRKLARRRPSLGSTRSASPTASTTSNFTTTSNTSVSTTSGLRMAPPARARLVSPAPRALTQYVAAGDDARHIALPSTIGLRGAPSDWGPIREESASYSSSYDERRGRRIDGMPSSASADFPPHLPPSQRDRERERDEWHEVAPRDWAPDAAHALRSALSPHPTPHPSSSALPSPASKSKSPGISPKLGVFRSPSWAGGSSGSARARSASRGGHTRSSISSTAHPASVSTPDLRTYSGANKWESKPPLAIIADLPSESTSPQSSEDGHDGRTGGEGEDGAAKERERDGAGEGCRAKEARSALKRILDEAPKPPPPPRTQFLPRSPPPLAHAAPSTATASVSRLFSKGGRHSVTQTQTKPVVGIMKGGSQSQRGTPTGAGARTPVGPGTPTGEGPSASASFNAAESSGSGSTGQASASASTAEASASKGDASGSKPRKDLTLSSLSLGLGLGMAWPRQQRASRPGSGASTPSTAKRISFAELPESYVKSTGRAPKSSHSSKSRAKSKSSRSKKGKGKAGESDSEDGAGGGGWLAWFVGGGGGGGGGMEERERVARGGGSAGWGGMGGRGAGDEWAV
ncbi:hypothetical protein DFH06DRAFT_1289770 [Mycena polygramma]|nr:hypothetical protein DFH06DRAFT_1289770 [Mycena polygramma]